MNLLQKLYLNIKSILDFNDLCCENAESVTSKTTDLYDEYECLFIERIIELLKTKPEDFSAKWFTGKTLDKSIKSVSKEILIIISEGQIVLPIRPKMTKQQKETIKQLIEPIVKRDINDIIKGVLSL